MKKVGLIHHSAIIEPGAQIDETAEIGPYCYISAQAKIGANCRLIAHVTILGDTTIGEHNIIFPQACLGGSAQEHVDTPLDGARLIIGAHSVIRENVTMHVGTEKGQTSDHGEVPEKRTTRVGSHCLFMVGSHVAHDCVVGDYVTISNNALLAGHVRIGNHVTIGGNSAIHQWTRIGDGAMIGGMTGVGQDVIPYGMVAHGTPGKLRGINLVGMQRAGFDREMIKTVTDAYMYIFKSTEETFKTRLQTAKLEFADNPIVQMQIAFIEQADHSPRHLLVAR